MAAPLDKLFTRELERNDDEIVKISQSEIGDVGCVVWDAAIVLSKYLETHDFDGGKSWMGKKVVELGAGTGVVGLFAASYGADVIITDLPEFVPLMELNIKENTHIISGSAEACTLTWGQDKSTKFDHIDFIIIADCIYYEESLEPLVSTITELSDMETTVLCCYEQRDTGNKPELEKKFFQLIRESFDVSKIPQENQDLHFRSEDIHILKFTKKQIADAT
ncbi:protein N-lysine methyltransferase METTL21D-like [Haliotis rufescens]|uniref:protein N-lysine methyltransferase METTL21D-like n=1 Tax=Haliotis rufescens TaxID=6454 RepID=UPI00201FAAE7|nr:protein N-lysine methyltransferase METTL21D-like [Haliotis rufescens]XP_046374634.2 protein N-lysine methyltransferase METTL21D-like [Haliotis rufescens]